MSYTAKTNWKLDDTVMPADMNRIEQGIVDMGIDIESVSKTISIIEPSDTNIVDLNSFTDTGIYIIKNATNSIVLNSPFTSTNAYDIYLIVTSYASSTATYSIQRFLAPLTINSYYGRQYTNLTWSEWVCSYTHVTITIPTTGWSSEAPYTTTIAISLVKASDVDVVAIPQWDSDLTTRQAQQEAWSLVSMITTNDGSITVTCDEEIPQTAIPIMLFVNR